MKFGNIRILPAQTPAIDATPDYAAADSLFTTPMELVVNGCQGGQGVVQAVTVTDKANQKPALTILFFKAPLAGGTYTKNGGLVLSVADRGNCLGKIEIASTDWTSLSGEAVATAYGPLPVKGKESAGGTTPAYGPTQFTVYVLVMVGGAYNAGAVDDLTFQFSLLGD